MGSHTVNNMLENIEMKAPRLYEICKNKEKETVKCTEKEIIKCTLDSSYKYVDGDGNTILSYACYNNMQNIAIKLLKIDSVSAYLSQPVNRYGYTALLYACCNSMDKVAHRLVCTDSNPQQIDPKYGYTALLYACQNNMSYTALKLLDELSFGNAGGIRQHSRGWREASPSWMFAATYRQ